MSPPKYKLTYFHGRGRAEVSRLIFAQAGVEYEDVRLNEFNEEWSNFKPNTPNGQTPVLEIDGKMYCQSNAISRYLAKKFGLHPKDPEDELQLDMIVDTVDDMVAPLFRIYEEQDPAKKASGLKKFAEEQLPTALQNLEKMLISNKGGDAFFVGDELTWADLMFFVWGTWPCIEEFGVEVDLSKVPKLEALNDRVGNQPRIAAWVKKRPDTPF